MIRLFAPRDFIDVETRGPDEMRRRALEFKSDNRSPSEWRVLARRLADLVDAPVKPRDLIRRACRELGIGPNAARNALATAELRLLRFDSHQGLWCRMGVAP